MSKGKIALIIGAGPAGLTAAYELLKRTDIKPVIIELTDSVGGICKTINYKGNRMDLGGHRFFSKSDRVMNWWLNILPLEKSKDKQFNLTYHNQSYGFLGKNFGPDPLVEDKVMLLRKRKSRIYFLNQFFDYPISFSPKTLSQLGFWRVVKIGLSYMRSVLFPIKPEKNLEEFFINRFGKELYFTFFKSYTEKVWGQSCTEISSEWGAQRIKGLSITNAILHVIRNLFSSTKNIEQKKTETSLIEYFLYPKYGPGQLWDEVALQIKQMGGEILVSHTITSISVVSDNVKAATIQKISNNQSSTMDVDYLFSTMPVKELMRLFDSKMENAILKIADGLRYRNFITVGILVKKINIIELNTKEGISDNWIYIQDGSVKLGRLQVFNNWSPFMVADKNNYWLGLEYFCNEEDELWLKSEKEMLELATEELCKLGIVDRGNVLDGTVIHVPKAYPAYFGTYPDFEVLRKFVEPISNLFLIGRNGMHKYNNQDHSMLTAMVAVDNIIANVHSKENIWAVNTEEDYHESK